MNPKEEFEQAKALLPQNFEEGWRTILRLAQANYEDAMVFVALSYYRGDGVEMDEPLAYRWFERIVELYPDNGFIWNKLADCHFYGYGVPKSHKESIGFYEKAWEHGFAAAASSIGWIYSMGDIPNRNDMVAAKWHQRAASKNDPDGFYFLGLFYAEGYGGLPVNDTMAARNFRRAIEQDHFSAMRYMLRKKCYGDNDEFLALRDRFFKMAEDGDDRAAYSLGLAYLLGNGFDFAFDLERNPYQAQKWLEISADRGNRDAAYELGRNLVDDDNDFLLDYEKGEKYLLMAAEKGHSNACYEMSRLCKWHKKDIRAAHIWAERSIELGETYLIPEVAENYMKGTGVEANYEKAGSYYLRCIKDDMEDRRSNLSYLPLAKCYLLKPYTTDGEYRDAYIYLKLALDAANRKGYCADQKGEIEYWIAYMLDNGLGMPSDLDSAISHYTRSTELGFEKAQEALRHFKKTFFGWKRI